MQGIAPGYAYTYGRTLSDSVEVSIYMHTPYLQNGLFKWFRRSCSVIPAKSIIAMSQVKKLDLTALPQDGINEIRR